MGADIEIIILMYTIMKKYDYHMDILRVNIYQACYSSNKISGDQNTEIHGYNTYYNQAHYSPNQVSGDQYRLQRYMDIVRVNIYSQTHYSPNQVFGPIQNQRCKYLQLGTLLVKLVIWMHDVEMPDSGKNMPFDKQSTGLGFICCQSTNAVR